MVVDMLTSLLLLILLSHETIAEFNQQVSRRIAERLNDFMNVPVKTNLIFRNHVQNGGFPFDLTAPDRDAYNKLAWTMMETFDIEYTSYAREDGAYMINLPSKSMYREPGNSGYDATEGQIPPEKFKYINTCVNERGESKDCLMEPGDFYINCIEGCSLQPCSDAKSQRDCEALADVQDKIECKSEIKWCHQYEIKQATEESRLGYIPLTSYCANDKGEMTQTDGEVRISEDESGKDCLFDDKETKVNRFIEGDYAYCGGNGEICNSTFIGGFRSRNFDPRWRPWYKECKLAQTSMWTDVYSFFESSGTGITYVAPIYSMEDDKNVFEGVLGVDYLLTDIALFLYQAYHDTSMTVFVYEVAEPYFLIASSLNVEGTKKVLAETEDKPCPAVQTEGCKIVRIHMRDIGDAKENSMNSVIASAFMKQKQEGFPEEELVVIKSTEHGSPVDSKAYLSQSQIFEQPDANLRWRLLIVMPMDTATGNAIIKGNGLFPTIIIIGVLGFTICFTLFVLIYNRRKRRAIIYSDWKFTSAFILGCATLNLSSLLLLGPNTNSLCLSRMFVFHWLFVAALAPLFAKTIRMYQLVGKKNIRRKTISNKKALLYTLPFILIQTMILVIFAVFDPPKKTEIIKDVLDGDFVQNLVCKQKNNAFMIVELVFEGVLVFIGCFLAWKTRDMSKDFGEARQMIAAMYNIAFVGVVIILVSTFVTVEEASKYALQAIGTLWGTVFSSAAFVVPRLLQNVRENPIRTKISGVSMDKSGNEGNMQDESKALKKGDSYLSTCSIGLSYGSHTSEAESNDRNNVVEVNMEEKKSNVTLTESGDIENEMKV